MTCYCEERAANAKLKQEMNDIPIGYCGVCEVCGKFGHTHAHPRLPITGAWCDEHWNALIKYKMFTLGDIVQYAFYILIVGLFIYSIISALKVFY